MFDTLRKELNEMGKHINPETLQDILDDKISLTATAHSEFVMFMAKGREMFGLD